MCDLSADLRLARSLGLLLLPVEGLGAVSLDWPILRWDPALDPSERAQAVCRLLIKNRPLVVK